MLLATFASLAIVVSDHASVRSTPRSAATELTTLWQGDVVEIRGEQAEYLKVYSYRRERGGYLRNEAVRKVGLSEADAPELLAVMRFLRDTPGSEALGISYGAAYLKAVSPRAMTSEAFDAIGQMAERLADTASGRGAQATSVAARLEVVSQFGVRMRSFERNGRMQVCYDGELFRSVLTQAGATAEQRAHAVLALTRADCIEPDTSLTARAALDEERRDLLEGVQDTNLTPATRSRLRARRAAVWSAITFAQARHGQPAAAAAQRALAELTAVHAADLGETYQSEYADAVLRVSAIRWATAQGAVGSQSPAAPPLQTPTRVAATALPLTQTLLRGGADNQPSPAGLAVAAPLVQTPVRAAATPVPLTQTSLRAGADNQPSPAGHSVVAASVLVPGGSFSLSTTAGAEPGQTCLTLEDSRSQRPKATLARRCTFGIIWLASAQTIPQTQALVLSVQPMESWRELWVFHQIAGKWLVDVISPGLDEPDEGYVEYAGFAPGTSRILLVREVKERARFRRWFEEVRLDDLVLVRQASTPELLRDFGRWQDVRWRRDTLALR
jgi:hypothetical protein